MLNRRILEAARSKVKTIFYETAAMY